MIVTFRPVYGWALLAVLVAAVLCLFVSVQLGVFALFFAIVAWWTWLNPQASLLWLLMIAPLLSMFKATQVLGLVTLFKDIIILVLFLRVCVYPLFTHQLPYRRQILWTPYVVLWLWVACATLRADSLTLGVIRARDLLLYSLLYPVLVFLPYSRRYLKELAMYTGVAFLITTILGIYQWFFAVDSTVLRFDPIRSIWIPRLSSTFGHPSVYGEYLVVISSLGAAIFLLAKQTWLRILSLLVGLMCVPLLYLTYSRGVWLGAVVAIGTISCAYAWQQLRERGLVAFNQKYVASALILLCLVAFGAIKFTRVDTFIRTAFDPTYESNRLRLEFVARLIAPMSNIDALIGRGLGDVTQQIFRESDVTTFDITSGNSRTVQLAKDATLVDNQYLKTFVEMGLVGLLIYVWLIWRYVRGSWQLFTGPRHDTVGTTAQMIGLMSLGFITSFIIQAFFIDIWDIFPTNLIFWVLAGLTSALLTPHVVERTAEEMSITFDHNK